LKKKEFKIEIDEDIYLKIAEASQKRDITINSLVNRAFFNGLKEIFKGDVKDKTTGTNPCAEVPLKKAEKCTLGTNKIKKIRVKYTPDIRYFTWTDIYNFSGKPVMSGDKVIGTTTTAWVDNGQLYVSIDMDIDVKKSALIKNKCTINDCRFLDDPEDEKVIDDIAEKIMKELDKILN